MRPHSCFSLFNKSKDKWVSGYALPVAKALSVGPTPGICLSWVLVVLLRDILSEDRIKNTTQTQEGVN